MNPNEWALYESSVKQIARYISWYGANQEDLDIIKNYKNQCEQHNIFPNNEVLNSKNLLDTYLEETNKISAKVKIIYEYNINESSLTKSLLNLLLLKTGSLISAKGNYTIVSDYFSIMPIVKFEGDILIKENDTRDVMLFLEKSSLCSGYLVK